MFCDEKLRKIHATISAEKYKLYLTRRNVTILFGGLLIFLGAIFCGIGTTIYSLGMKNSAERTGCCKVVERWENAQN